MYKFLRREILLYVFQLLFFAEYLCASAWSAHVPLGKATERERAALPGRREAEEREKAELLKRELLERKKAEEREKAELLDRAGHSDLLGRREEREQDELTRSHTAPNSADSEESLPAREGRERSLATRYRYPVRPSRKGHAVAGGETVTFE